MAMNDTNIYNNENNKFNSEVYALECPIFNNSTKNSMAYIFNELQS